MDIRAIRLQNQANAMRAYSTDASCPRAAVLDTVAPATPGFDSVNVSAQGRLVSTSLRKADLAAALFGFTPEKTGRVTLDELEKHGRDFLSRFNAKVQSLCAEQGIDAEPPVHLGTASGSGAVVVLGDHPDKAAVETLFRNRPELANDFRRISNMLTVAAEGRKALEFQQSYAQNPQKALQQYSFLFTSRFEGSIRLSPSGADFSVSSVSAIV